MKSYFYRRVSCSLLKYKHSSGLCIQFRKDYIKKIKINTFLVPNSVDEGFAVKAEVSGEKKN